MSKLKLLSDEELSESVDKCKETLKNIHKYYGIKSYMFNPTVSRLADYVEEQAIRQRKAAYMEFVNIPFAFPIEKEEELILEKIYKYIRKKIMAIKMVIGIMGGIFLYDLIKYVGKVLLHWYKNRKP